jgi:hypothetical protein
VGTSEGFDQFLIESSRDTVVRHKVGMESFYIQRNDSLVVRLHFIESIGRDSVHKTIVHVPFDSLCVNRACTVYKESSRVPMKSGRMLTVNIIYLIGHKVLS